MLTLEEEEEEGGGRAGVRVTHIRAKIIVYPWENLQCLSAGG